MIQWPERRFVYLADGAQWCEDLTTLRVAHIHSLHMGYGSPWGTDIAESETMVSGMYATYIIIYHTYIIACLQLI